MNRNEVIRIAREAGSIDSEEVIETVYVAFAAAEREACAQLCESQDPYVYSERTANACASAIRSRSNT